MQARQSKLGRSFSLAILLTGPLLLPVPAFAQNDVSALELRRCAAIDRGVERLDCYDAIARELSEAATPDTQALSPEAALETAAPGDHAESTATEDVDAFGAEFIDDGNQDRGTEQIESRIVGDFTGWRGNTVFPLENGQVWQQIEQTRFVYHADSPVVTIRRGTFGGYRLRVDGLNRSVRVRRIE